MQVWDTAGQERFRTITQTYYKGSSAIFLVYDVTDQKSFDNITNWMKQIENHAAKDVVKILVANKVDSEHRVVSEEEGKELAKEFGCPYFETSAKTGQNIDLIFEYSAEKLVSVKKYPRYDTIKSLKDPDINDSHYSHRKKKSRLCKWFS
jgi:small GTP-binding protein